MKPVCGVAGKCRGCKSHGECLSPSILCALDGSCHTATSVCAAGCTCTDLACGITGGKGKFVLVKGTLSDLDLALKGNFEVHGDGATLKVAGCDKLTIEGGSTIALAGFRIVGNVKVKDTSSATLVRDDIGPSACIGVDVDKDAKVILERSVVHEHTKGGVSVGSSYQVRNSIIVKNGTPAGVGGETTWGGLKIASHSATSCMANNTIAFNSSKGSNEDEAGGVRCESAATTLDIVNTILWGNTLTKSTAPHQYGSKCTVSSSLETDPAFVSATDYHIQKGSPAYNTGSMNLCVPLDDFDGQPRSDGKPDIGADEIQ
jgi:hypothetical protein